MYEANEKRYEDMPYRRCGQSGVQLPTISLGMWHNFGDTKPFETARSLARCAFDRGIIHFDLANNYGPPAGSAEETMGRLLELDFRPYRDELFISSKAGYFMWNGPFGDGGSRKYLVSSLDQSLTRMKLSYVDLFYHHRPDPYTPMEETAEALAQIVRAGKALYIGLSNYSMEQLEIMLPLLREKGVPCLAVQFRYSMLNRDTEELFDLLEREGVGSVAYSPLAQGILTSRYLSGIPSDSRATVPNGFLRPEAITEGILAKVRKLSMLAAERGQAMSQLALAWVLRYGRLTSALVGASRTEQLEECADTVKKLDFSEEELSRVDEILRSNEG